MGSLSGKDTWTYAFVMYAPRNRWPCTFDAHIQSSIEVHFTSKKIRSRPRKGILQIPKIIKNQPDTFCYPSTLKKKLPATRLQTYRKSDSLLNTGKKNRKIDPSTMKVYGTRPIYKLFIWPPLQASFSTGSPKRKNEKLPAEEATFYYKILFSVTLLYDINTMRTNNTTKLGLSSYASVNF